MSQNKEKKLLKSAEYANTCYAVPVGKGIFQVQSGDFQYNVDIVGRHCDCRRWDLTGLPCSHAISCLRHERIPTESVVPHCYSVQAFAEAYGFIIWPCVDKSEWFKVVGCPEVLPQSMRRRLAGQKKSRRKQPHEVTGEQGSRMSKHGVEMHCSHCKEAGHNTAGCSLKKLGLKRKAAAPQADDAEEKVLIQVL